MSNSPDLYDIYQHLTCTSHSMKQVPIHNLERLMEDPTPENWERVHQYTLRKEPYLNLWMAVRQVDPTFPATGRITDADNRVWIEWARVPDRDLIIRALEYAAYGEDT